MPDGHPRRVDAERRASSSDEIALPRVGRDRAAFTAYMRASAVGHSALPTFSAVASTLAMAQTSDPVMTAERPMDPKELSALEKDEVGRAAADLVESGMLVGLGSGSTAARFVVHLAARRLRIRCIAPSVSAAELADSVGLDVEPWEALPSLGRLDIAVDGADQVASDGWIVKGGGGAHRRERVVARAAGRFVVIVDSSKLVERIHPPIPLEIAPGDVTEALAALATMGRARVRDGWPPSPDGGVIADLVGPVDDPGSLAARLAAVPGVLDHGLFGPSLVSDVLVARGGRVVRYR